MAHNEESYDRNHQGAGTRVSIPDIKIIDTNMDDTEEQQGHWNPTYHTDRRSSRDTQEFYRRKSSTGSVKQFQTHDPTDASSPEYNQANRESYRRKSSTGSMPGFRGIGPYEFRGSLSGSSSDLQGPRSRSGSAISFQGSRSRSGSAVSFQGPRSRSGSAISLQNSVNGDPEPDVQPAAILALPDLHDYMTSPRSSSTSDGPARGSVSEAPPDRRRRRSVNDISFNVQPRKSITEISPKMQAQIAKFEPLSDSRRSSDDTTPDVGRRESTTGDLVDRGRRGSTRGEVVDLGRRGSTRGEAPDIKRRESTREEIPYMDRRRSTREEIPNVERRRSTREEIPDMERRKSTREEIPDMERRRSTREEIPDMERRRSTREEIPEMERRRSTRGEIPDMERRRSTRGEIPDMERRRSTREETPDMERRRSTREEIPDMERRRSTREEIPDMERRRSTREEIPDMERRRSTRGEIPDMERRRSTREETPDMERRRSTREEIPDMERRRSTREEIPDMERRRSTRGEIPDMERRRSTKGEIPDMERRRSTREEIPDMERRRSTREEISDKERRRSTRLEAPDMERRRSTREDIPDMERRRSTREEIPDMERRRSTRGEIPDMERRRSTREEIPDMERRRSTREEIPDMERRRSTREEIPDMERRRSTRLEAPDMERRRSTRGEIPDMERRRSTREEIPDMERRRSTRLEAPDMERRRSTRGEIPDMERRRSTREEIPDMERRRSTREEIPDMERRRSTREDIVDMERRGSIREEIPDTKRRESTRDDSEIPDTRYDGSTNNESPSTKRRTSNLGGVREMDHDGTQLQEERAADPAARGSRRSSARGFLSESSERPARDGVTPELEMTMPDDNSEDDPEADEQFLKSVQPYLKYRKSVSELEPYLQHQNEVNRLMPQIQAQWSVKTEAPGTETHDPLGHEAPDHEPGRSSRNRRRSSSASGRGRRGSVNDEELDSQARRGSKSLVTDTQGGRSSRNSLSDREPDVEVPPSVTDGLQAHLQSILSMSNSNDGDLDHTQSSKPPRGSARKESLGSDTDSSLDMDLKLNEPVPNLEYRKSISDIVPGRGSISESEPELLNYRKTSDREEEGRGTPSIFPGDSYPEGLQPPVGGYPDDQTKLKVSDEPRKSMSVEVLDFLVRRFSSEPIPDHKSSVPLDLQDEERQPESLEDLKTRSPRHSGAGLDNEVHRSSSAFLESRWSPRGSTPGLEVSSPRGSTAGLESLSPGGSQADLETGELEVPVSEEPRRSISLAVFDFLARRLSDLGATDDTSALLAQEQGGSDDRSNMAYDPEDQRSNKSSVYDSEDDRSFKDLADDTGRRRSYRGSAGDLERLASPRSSLGEVNGRKSTRDSSSDLQGRRSPGESKADLENEGSYPGTIPRIQHPASDSEGDSTGESDPRQEPRHSISDADPGYLRRGSSSKPSQKHRIDIEPLVQRPSSPKPGWNTHQSPRGSVASVDDQDSPRGSTPDDHRSPRGSRTDLDDYRSPRGSRTDLEAHRSPRGSKNDIEYQRSLRDSRVYLDDQEEPMDSSASPHTRRSSRGSIKMERRGTFTKTPDQHPPHSMDLADHGDYPPGSGSDTESNLDVNWRLDEPEQGLEHRKSITDTVPSDESNDDSEPELLSYRLSSEKEQGSTLSTSFSQRRKSFVEEPERDEDNGAPEPVVSNEPRRSIGMEVFNYLVRRFSDEPIPDHQSSQPWEENGQDGKPSSPADSKTHSRRSSSSFLEDRRSTRGSTAGLESRLPRGSTAGLETRSPRGSTAGLESRSPRGSTAGLETRSPRGSTAGLESRSPRGSTAGLESRSPRGSTAGLETRSPRDSTAGLESRSPRGSTAGLESRSPRGSTAGLETRSPRDSTAGLEARSPRGSTAGLETRSPRGSTAGLEARSPRGSNAGLEARSPRGSNAGMEAPSRKSSVSVSETQSRRGSSASLREQGSRRNSAAGVEPQSPRGSLSPRTSVSEGRLSPRGSTAGLLAPSSRGSEEDVETDVPSTKVSTEPRRSISMAVFDFLAGRLSGKTEADKTAPVGQEQDFTGVTETAKTSENRRSPRGSVGDLEGRISPRGSVGDLEGRISPRGSVGDLEGRISPRGSVGHLEGRRSPRGSVGDLEVRTSPRGSVGNLKDRISPRGSMSNLEGRISPRGSIGDLGGNRSNRGSVEELQSRRLSVGTYDNLKGRESPRDAVSEKEQRSSRRSSVAGLEGRRPSRGTTAYLEDGSLSGKIPIIHYPTSDEDSTHDLGWPASEAASRRSRRSISDAIPGAPGRRFSTEDQEHRLSGKIEPMVSNEPRKSIGMEMFNYLVRRFSGVELGENGPGRETDATHKSPRGSRTDLDGRRSSRGIIELGLSSDEEIHDLSDDSESNLGTTWRANGTESNRKSSLRSNEVKPVYEKRRREDLGPDFIITEYYYMDTKTGDLYSYEVPDLHTALYQHIMTILCLPDIDMVEQDLPVPSVDFLQKSGMLEDSSDLDIIGPELMQSITRLDDSNGWTTMEALQKEKIKKPLGSIKAVTFCGCGFLGVYLVGAATCLKENAPSLLRGKLAGSSVGSLIATCIVCDVPLQVLRETLLKTAKVSRSYILGSFNPFFPLEEPLLRNLLEMLPEDAHIRATGRLHLSLTRASTLTNEVVSEYKTRDELLRAVLCCCFLPGISGFSLPTFQGRRYIDGGMSNNMPLKSPTTLSINAFAGEFDICPVNDGKNYGPTSAFNQTLEMSPDNLRKFFLALVPPEPEDLDVYYDQGYADTLKYISS
ncbi:uncharacterized protein [Panulirus ornatus]|uniref:uncharacterized protein isoform X2 n=1 Tax=Panulirus ornatus TaxID=150431 RepID=UPI003A8913AC